MTHIIGIDASRAARNQRTGTETYSLELIKAIARLLPAGWRLRLYTPHPPQHSDWPAMAGVETRVIAWPRLWTHMRLAMELRQDPPAALFVPAHVLPVYCPVPAIVTVHDLGYLHYPEAHPAFDRRYLHWTTHRHCRVAQHILADSQATKQDLIEHYHADPNRISVVHLGRDETLAPVKDTARIAAVKQKCGINGDYMLYLGTLHPRKNLNRLIEAFHAVCTSTGNKTLKLVIAGKKGWLFDEIFSRVEQLQLTERVIFPGYVDDTDKAALLSGATAYVFPSLYEGFGLPVLEAMACGTPVLTSNSSSLPEVAGEAALLVNPHSVEEIATGLHQLIADAPLRRKFAAQGYLHLENFSWQKAAEQVLNILKNMVDAP
jgi:glycosyltransferase involved in cell wall biosynthesis